MMLQECNPNAKIKTLPAALSALSALPLKPVKSPTSLNASPRNYQLTGKTPFTPLSCGNTSKSDLSITSQAQDITKRLYELCGPSQYKYYMNIRFILHVRSFVSIIKIIYEYCTHICFSS
jgi:hypothetical protein